MRTVRIPNCSYEQWEAIFDEIAQKVPFALLNQFYRPKLKLAVFNFWDSDYIPTELQKYILNPPAESKFDFSSIDLPEIDTPAERRSVDIKYKSEADD